MDCADMCVSGRDREPSSKRKEASDLAGWDHAVVVEALQVEEVHLLRPQQCCVLAVGADTDQLDHLHDLETG